MSNHAEYDLGEQLLVVRGLTKDYGSKHILAGIDFEIRDALRKDGVKQGQVLGILGPSGMGKTTLFRCIAGLEQPSSGEVLITEKLEPVKVGKIGVVDQGSTTFRWRRVFDGLMIAARGRHKRTAAEAKDLVMSALAEYGIADKAQSYPSELSGGQRQRVAIIAQLLSSDGLLLMDEPFSALDSLAKDVACEAILKVSHLDDRNTTIVITHDISSAVQICDTIRLLGRKRDEAGNSLGATVVRTYDLIERGLAWNEGIDQMPEFHEMVREIKNDFRVC